MSTRAHYHPRRIDIDMARLDPQLYAEIVSLHGHIDPPPAAPVLSCLHNGEPMTLHRHQSGRYFPWHYPGGNPDGHTHPALAAMSIEHRRQAEYIQRAGIAAHLDAQLEKSTGNGTRLDVAVSGTHNIGFEVQRSALSRAKAKSRATKSFTAGWPTAWITDNPRDPYWADHVPTARLTTRSWDTMPPHHTARVSIGEFSRERDRTSRTGWRYVREPRAILLDELTELMPAGEIIPVTVGTKGKVALAFRGAAEIIDSCTYDGASL
ncbi:hypothetical protein, partial [Mycolicibacterium porcinum]|uniref:hypothetical protein n=1 Tax=Mycolicibacterium porcinum TaxID=39693 RepID=UPI0009F56358